eukprot:1195515-Prorocentrum_minimum.AAC.12
MYILSCRPAGRIAEIPGQSLPEAQEHGPACDHARRLRVRKEGASRVTQQMLLSKRNHHRVKLKLRRGGKQLRYSPSTLRLRFARATRYELMNKNEQE